MFRRTVLSALAIAAGVGAGLLLKVLQDRNSEQEDEYDDDEEIHFIRINDDDDEEPAEPAGKEDISPEVREISGLYPYLTSEFISGLLARNSELNQAYPEDTLISLDHNAVFDSRETADRYAEIMEAAGYQCSVQEDGGVTAGKKLFTEDGAIISDILNVANQAAALKGTYKDYQIR